MSISEPKVTVLMPVYNGEPYLRKAIESILNQTFTDFEFLIINDGSVDRTVSIIELYNDPRITLIHNESNLGLVATLNKGLDLARGEYIARMDSDDLCLPERIAKQVLFMDLHPEVGVCGTGYEDMKTGRNIIRPTEHEDIIEFMLKSGCALAHPTVMIRTAVLRKNRLYYDPDYQQAEDFELWTRMIKVTHLANIPEVLVRHRTHSSQISRKFAQELELKTNQILDLFRKSLNYTHSN